MKLKYQTKEEIPQGKEDLYTQQGTEWVFTGVEGMKTQADIDRMAVGLQKERDEHKTTKEKLKAWEGLERAKVDETLAAYEELKVKTDGSIPKADLDKKLDELTEVRLKNRMLPVERKLADAEKKLAEAEKQIVEFKARETQRTIHDKVRAAGVIAKVRPEVEADVLLLADNVFTLTDDGQLLTKENVFGVDAGLTPESFFTVQQEKRPWWWPTSVGGGSKGSGGGGGTTNNPWTAANWNLTEQGKIVKEQGLEKAQQLAKMAGTVVGGAKPADKK